MKIRTFKNMDNSVFRVVVNTEDFSQEDLKLMCQYGEPEVNCGGTVSYEFEDEPKSKELGDQWIRILHGFPYVFGFDSRDYGSCGEAEAAGDAWKEGLVDKIKEAMRVLREKASVLPAEEVENV